MGAHHSSSAATAAAVASCSCEDSGPSYDTDKVIPAANASSVPPSPMPVLARPETFEEKLYRKVSVYYLLFDHSFELLLLELVFTLKQPCLSVNWTRCTGEMNSPIKT